MIILMKASSIDYYHYIKNLQNPFTKHDLNSYGRNFIYKNLKALEQTFFSTALGAGHIKNMGPATKMLQG